MAEMLRSLRTFSEKCGIADGSLGSTAIEMTDGGSRGVALARVAVWSAIRDVWDINGYLTPGQVASVVDAAPLLLGSSGLKEISTCKTISKLDAFVRANAPRWCAGATAISQLWSLKSLAGAESEQTRTTNFTDAEISQVAVASAIVKSGAHRDSDPSLLLQSLDPKSGVPGELLRQAAAGRPSSSPKTANDRAATVMHLARQGNFEALASSGIMESFVTAAAAGAKDQETEQLSRRDGAFLGPRNLDDIRRLGEAPKSGEPLIEYFSKTPSGQYPARILESFPLNGNEISSDMAIAAMHGLSTAWANYSPIVPEKGQASGKGSIRVVCNDLEPLIETQVRKYATKAYQQGRPEEIVPGHLAAAPSMEVAQPVEGETLNLGKTSFKVVDQSMSDTDHDVQSMANRINLIHEALVSRNPALARRFADLPSGTCAPEEVEEMKAVLSSMAEEKEIPPHLGTLLDSAYRLVERSPAISVSSFGMSLPEAPITNLGDRMVERLASLAAYEPAPGS